MEQEAQRAPHTAVDRRSFLRVSTAAVATAVTGVEGILAARRAPAYAQGAKLHILRWVDFVPAADEALNNKLIPEAKTAGNAADVEKYTAELTKLKEAVEKGPLSQPWIQLKAAGFSVLFAFALSVNKYPAGQTEAPKDPAELKNVKMAAPKS